MPSSKISINGQDSLSWEVPDSRMEAVISVLDIAGARVSHAEAQAALGRSRNDHDKRLNCEAPCACRGREDCE